MTHADHITPWHPDCAICRAVTDPGIAEPDPLTLRNRGEHLLAVDKARKEAERQRALAAQEVLRQEAAATGHRLAVALLGSEAPPADSWKWGMAPLGEPYPAESKRDPWEGQDGQLVLRDAVLWYRPPFSNASARIISRDHLAVMVASHSIYAAVPEVPNLGDSADVLHRPHRPGPRLPQRRAARAPPVGRLLRWGGAGPVEGAVMSEPTTIAGRTLIAAFVTPLPKDAIELSIRGLIQTAVPAIEAEAVAAYRADLAAKVRALPDGCAGSFATGHAQDCPFPAVLALIEGEPQ